MANDFHYIGFRGTWEDKKVVQEVARLMGTSQSESLRLLTRGALEVLREEQQQRERRTARVRSRKGESNS